MTHPAFILGTAPTLPLDQLHELHSCFTVGINRLLKSGYVPTAMFGVDPLTRVEWQREWSDVDTLFVFPTVDRHAFGGCVGLELELFAGSNSNLPPHSVACDGNSGVAAARWALSLGCEPVYILGMSGKFVGSQCDFFPSTHGPTLPIAEARLTSSRDKLLAEHGDRIIDADQLDLSQLAAGQDHDQQQLRTWLKEACAR